MSMIESLVEQIEQRFSEAQAQMSDPDVIADRQRYADAGRAFNHLAPAAKLAEEWRLAVSDAEGAEELLAEGEDPEMRAGLNGARGRGRRRGGGRSCWPRARIRRCAPSSTARASGSSGWRRRSGSRWSSATPTTTRT